MSSLVEVKTVEGPVEPAAVAWSGPPARQDSLRLDPILDTDRNVKIAMFLVAGALLVAIDRLVQYYGVSFTRWMVMLLVFACATWFFPWIYLLWAAKTLFRVRVKMRRMEEGWLPISVPYKSESDTSRAVFSVSEIAATRGTHTFVLMHVMSALIFITLLAVCKYDCLQRGTDTVSVATRESTTVLLLLFTITALPLLSLFELSAYDVVHVCAHYLGVTLMVVGTCALGNQRNWDALACSVIGTQVLAAVTWVTASYKLPSKSADIAVVTRTSKVCVALELVVFALNAVSVMLTVDGFPEHW